MSLLFPLSSQKFNYQNGFSGCYELFRLRPQIKEFKMIIWFIWQAKAEGGELLIWRFWWLNMWCDHWSKIQGSWHLTKLMLNFWTLWGFIFLFLERRSSSIWSSSNFPQVLCHSVIYLSSLFPALVVFSSLKFSLSYWGCSELV